MFDVLIISHLNDAVTQDSSYTINSMAHFFREAGLTVGLQKGLKCRVPAKIVINQIDLTVTPPDYVDYIQSFPAAINGRLIDISKSKVCPDIQVSVGDGYEGPVIVKTNLNCGGYPEWQLMRNNGVMIPGVQPRQDWLTTQFLDFNNYPVFDHPDQVPAGVWQNPHLVVQRCQTEKDDRGYFCLRSWYLLGDHGFHVMTLAPGPIVKGNNILDRRVLEEQTPVELEALRLKLGVDFGRFDYVMVNGKAIVFDVNRTPTSTPGAIKRYQPQWREMAKGISAFFPPHDARKYPDGR